MGWSHVDQRDGEAESFCQISWCLSIAGQTCDLESGGQEDAVERADTYRHKQTLPPSVI